MNRYSYKVTLINVGLKKIQYPISSRVIHNPNPYPNPNPYLNKHQPNTSPNPHSKMSLQRFSAPFQTIDLVWHEIAQIVRPIIPALSREGHKGQMGRVGILGGSRDYCGAPYYASTASLKFGADLSYIFCSSMAAPPIKSYSPGFSTPLSSFLSPSSLSPFSSFSSRFYLYLILFRSELGNTQYLHLTHLRGYGYSYL